MSLDEIEEAIGTVRGRLNQKLNQIEYIEKSLQTPQPTARPEAVVPEAVGPEFNYEGATKALKAVIGDYKLNVNNKIDTEISTLRQSIRSLNDQKDKLFIAQEQSGIYTEDGFDLLLEQVNKLNAREDNLLGLVELYARQGKPKSLHFDGQDYVRGLSYGANSWNPRGRGYTDGSNLQKIL